MVNTKKKTAALIFALALIVVLGVAGTLMLFTNHSEQATNVVTLGDAKIVMMEKGGEGDAKNAYVTIGEILDAGTQNERTFTGIELTKDDQGNVPVAGSKIVKKPLVKNTGTIPVYLFTQMDLTAWNAQSQKINLKDSTDAAKYFEDYNGDTIYNQVDTNLILADLAASFGDQDNWYGIKSVLKDGGTMSGGYFYVEDNDASQVELKPLAAGDSTIDIFESVTIPLNLDLVSDDVTFKLELKTYAVQSNYNPASTLEESTYASDLNNWRDDVFAGTFQY